MAAANHPTHSLINSHPHSASGVPSHPASSSVSDRYVLGAEMDRGGMGIIYRATDTVLGREVAVKVLHDKYTPESGAALRFADEARITSQLQHPSIPPVHDLGTLPDGRPFLAMKLIKGQTLEESLKARTDPAVDRGRFVAVFEQVCQALAYAHSHDVIHRDLKPANVMVGAFGEVQVMDWGLAKVLGAHTAPASPTETAHEKTRAWTQISPTPELGSHTQAGSLLGTPAFAPPEQALGEIEKVDARADVFGLGAILAVLLTGKPPYVGETAESVRVQAVRGKLDDCFARLAACGAEPELVALCQRCLSFEPADRPANAGAVAKAVAALRAAADERARRAELQRVRVEGEQATAEAKAAERRKRRRLWIGAAAALAMAVVAGLTAVVVVQSRANRDLADEQAKVEARNQELAEERRQADLAKTEAQAKEAEAKAVVKFFEEKVFAAARPKDQDGGLGAGVTLRDAIAASEPALDKDFAQQPLVEARLRMALGTTFFYLAEHDQARIQFERARVLCTQHRGPDHRDTLACMHNLANSYLKLNRPTEALKLREEVVAIEKRVLPKDHPDTLSSMAHLAFSYEALNRLDEALKLREEVLAIQKRVLPKDHTDTLASMINLAISYADLNRPTEAIKLQEEVLAIQKQVLPKDHPNTLNTMNSLAVSYFALNRPAEALKLREEVLAARKRVLPKDHSDTLGSMANLAISYHALNRTADAHKLFEEVLAIQKRVLPKDHPHTLGSMHNLATSYTSLNRPTEAAKLLEEVLAIRKRALPEDDPNTLMSMTNLAVSYAALNRHAEALPLLNEFLAKADRPGVDPRLVLIAIGLRLQCCQKANDPAGCRASAEMWEKLNRPDAESLYNAARSRAVTAAVQAKAPGTDAARLAKEDADKAMAWLTKAVAAGFKDVEHMKQDKDLDALGGREDFKKLQAELEAPKAKE